jgi:hypothetical protein
MQRQAFVNAIMNLLVPNTVWQFRKKDYVHVTQLIKMLSNHFVRKWNWIKTVICWWGWTGGHVTPCCGTQTRHAECRGFPGDDRPPIKSAANLHKRGVRLLLQTQFVACVMQSVSVHHRLLWYSKYKAIKGTRLEPITDGSSPSVCCLADCTLVMNTARVTSLAVVPTISLKINF